MRRAAHAYFGYPTFIALNGNDGSLILSVVPSSHRRKTMSGRFRALCRLIATPLAAVFLVTSMPLHVAQAGLVPTERVIEDLAGPDERASVERFLAREDVRQELLAMGVDPAEAVTRVRSLSDDEISRLADVIRHDPAGGDAFGVIIGAALLIFIVLLITDIAGVTKVFPFTRSIR